MESRTITIRVDEQAARIYEAANADERRQLETLLSLKLTEAARSSRPVGRGPEPRGLKRLLEDAPLNNVDLSRPRDYGRKVDF